jgi:hypothetical protein
MKTITGRFRLDEAKARALIARAEQRYEDEEDGGPPEYEVLRLPPDWEPRQRDETDAVNDLVYAAGVCGAIEGPQGTRLDFQFMDDSDGGAYQWWVLLEHANVRLVSPSEEYCRVGAPDVKGAEAAMAILKESVEQANYVLDAAAKA